MRFFFLILLLAIAAEAGFAFGVSNPTYVHPKPHKVRKHKIAKHRTVSV